MKESATSVSRTLRLLDAFDTNHLSLSLSEMARRADLPLSTAHRMVRELMDWGALVRNGNRYRIGHKLWTLGLLSSMQQDLRAIASPFMHDVLFLTKHVVNLFVLQEGEAVLVERFSGTETGRAVREVGESLPLHASAGGKIFLAFSPPSVRSGLGSNLRRLTQHTITDARKLDAEIAQVRRQGYATTKGEADENAKGVAVPVQMLGGTLIAALGVVLINEEPQLGRIIPILQAAARAIGRELAVTSGYGYPDDET